MNEISPPRFIVEYGHMYLQEIESGAFETRLKPDGKWSSKFEHLRKLIDLFEERDIPYDLVVTVDDTSDQYAEQFGSPSFVTFRNEQAQRYVSQLPIKPDGYYFESGFGGILSKLLSILPEAEPGALGQPDSWGTLRNKSKKSIYLYGTHEPGEKKPKIKLINCAGDSDKSTPYTCAAYDTAMTLAKFGLIGGPTEFKAYPHAISLYDRSFYRSQPFRKSTTFQQILFEEDVIPTKTHTPPRHLEVSPLNDFDTIRSFVLECESTYSDIDLPEHEHPRLSDPW
jgi:hypothetical protein